MFILEMKKLRFRVAQSLMGNLCRSPECHTPGDPPAVPCLAPCLLSAPHSTFRGAAGGGCVKSVPSPQMQTVWSRVCHTRPRSRLSQECGDVPGPTAAVRTRCLGGGSSASPQPFPSLRPPRGVLRLWPP